MTQVIRDVMSTDVALLAPDQTVVQAAQMMREKDIGALPVAADDRLVGMLTDRDIITRSIANGSSPDTTKVREVMSDGILYCFDDEPAEKVAANMGDNRVRRLPVVDREKRLVGIVSLGDIALEAPEKVAGEALEEISKPSNAK